MSALDLMDQKSVSLGFRPAQVQSTDLSDNISASFDSVMDNFRVNSESSLKNDLIDKRDEEYRQLTGRNIYDDAIADDKELSQINAVTLAGSKYTPDIQTKIDSLLTRLNAEKRFGDRTLINSASIEEMAKQKARDSLAKQQQVAAGATSFDRVAGGFIGGMGAMFFDPLNVASLPFGAGASRGILKTIFMEAGINAGVEAASQPFVAEWQNQIGNKYGFTDALENVGMAALFGGSIAGAGKVAGSAFEAFSSIKERFRKVDMPEQATASEYMARKAHVEESKVSALNENIEYAKHERALEEVNAALNEGRPLNLDKINIKDEEFYAIKADKAEPGIRSTLERYLERDVKEVAAQVKALKEDINPIMIEERPTLASVERQKEIEDLYNSPESIKAEQDDFIKNIPDDAPIEYKLNDKGDLEISKTAGDIKREIKETTDYLKTIGTCGL